MTDPTSVPDSTLPPDSTCILSAVLETDGSISLQIVFPGSLAPVAASIDPIETTIQAAGSLRRPVELRYGHPQDRLLRLVVAMHVDALAYERRHQPRHICVPNAELPLVTWICPSSTMTS